MKFTTPLPEGIYVKETFYPLNTDFKVWLKINEIMNSDFLSDSEKALSIIPLGYKNALPPCMEDALSGIIDFYSMFAKKTGHSKKEIFSFSEDAPFIYSAFYKEYKIDLFEANMHWWKFKALFDSLGEDNMFGRVIKYRTINLSDIKDKNLKAFYRKMKSLYKLKTSDNIADAFLRI